MIFFSTLRRFSDLREENSFNPFPLLQLSYETDREYSIQYVLLGIVDRSLFICVGQ